MGNYYVVKEIDTIPLNDKDTRKMMNETKFLNEINSNFIVGYIDTYIEGTNVNIVMEYCQNGDLFTYMERNKKPFVNNFIWKVFIHMCLGL